MSTTIYYKATRPDGTDFYTGTIPYVVGKRVRPHVYHGTPKVCGAGFLHAADVPAMSLVGGSWPCRLFEVTGRVAAGFDSQHRHKGGFRQLIVVREIDSHLALGPNGRYVAGIIERTLELTLDEMLDLRAAWDAAWRAARDAACGAACGAARGAAWRAAWDAARGAARGAAWDAVRGAAWDAARDAALAVLVRDLITAEQFNTLYGPWAKVIDGKDAHDE